MFNQSVPGALGAHNGGIDFNDVVHPMARALVEGLWGYAPNYPLGYVALAPRLPSSWREGAFTAPDFALAFADDAAAEQLTYTLRLTTLAPEIRMRLPVRACAVTAVSVEPAAGAAPEAFSWSSAPGFGQGEVLVNVTGAGAVTLVVRVAYAQPVPHVPAVELTVAGAVAGASVALPIFGAAGGGGLAARGAVSDPQGMFVSPTHNGTHVLGELGAQSLGHMLLFVTLAGGAGTSGAHALSQERMLKVFVTNEGGDGGGTVVLRTADATAQQRRVRLPDFANASALPLSANEIDASATAAAEPPAAEAKWLPANLTGAFNAQLGSVFDKVYLSPRPATCSARIGTDAYSAWTFMYGQGNPPPVPDLALAPALLGADGLVATPQGARFHVQGVSPGGAGGIKNIAFASQWDNFPASVSVTFPPPSGAGSKLWVLVAGTTNPMQTLLPNAELTATFCSGANATLQLTPPLNYWSLCAYGGADYDADRDAFALPLQPPAAVQLGKDTRAMVYAIDVPEGDAVASLTLTALSLEVVVGLLAASVAA